MSAGQQVLRRLDSAFRAFFRGQRGRPHFKRRDHFNSLNFKPGDGASLKGPKLYLQNVGLISVRWHRKLADGELKNIILLRKPSGWYVCLQVELPDPQPGPAVGIDVGLHQALLAEHHIQVSMSHTGNCYDNAPMESFFGSLKTEQVHFQHYQTRAEAQADIFFYLEGFYNRSRRHSTLAYLAPEHFEYQYFNQLF